MKFIKSRFVAPKLIGKTLDVSKATVTDQNILGKELAAKIGDRAFKKTISRFLPKIDIAASKRLQARQIKFGESKTQLQTKVPTSLPKRLSPVSTFTTSFGKNVKAKITKLQQQAYNLANIKQAKAYSKTTKKLGIEKSYKGSTADEVDILRSKVNTDARINVMVLKKYLVLILLKQLIDMKKLFQLQLTMQVFLIQLKVYAKVNQLLIL